jgi:hypothetical protein
MNLPSPTQESGDHAPVLIGGFHHSGTRLLAKMLQSMGVQQIVDDAPHEWKYINRLNERVCPGWCNPDQLTNWNPLDQDMPITSEDFFLTLQESGYLSGLWGAKDPRFCLTFLSWSKILGETKTIILHRDPLSVLGTFPHVYSFFTPHKRLPSEEMDFWSRLYCQYYRIFRLQCQASRSILEVRYEDIIQNAPPTLSRIADYLALDRTSERVTEAVSSNPLNIARASHATRAIATGSVDGGVVDTILSHTRHIREELGYS